MLTRLRRAARALFVDERDLLADQQDQFLAALERLVESQTRQAEASSAAIVAQAGVFRDYLALFKVEGKPETWTTRDEDELAAYNKQLMDAGMPPGLAPVDSLRWVLDNSGR